MFHYEGLFQAVPECFHHFFIRSVKLCLLTYSLSLPLEWSQITHIPASITEGGVYKPEKAAFYSTLARQLFSQMALRLQASFTHANSHSVSYNIVTVPNEVKKRCILFTTQIRRVSCLCQVHVLYLSKHSNY